MEKGWFLAGGVDFSKKGGLVFFEGGGEMKKRGWCFEKGVSKLMNKGWQTMRERMVK